MRHFDLQERWNVETAPVYGQDAVLYLNRMCFQTSISQLIFMFKYASPLIVVRNHSRRTFFIDCLFLLYPDTESSRCLVDLDTSLVYTGTFTLIRPRTVPTSLITFLNFLDAFIDSEFRPEEVV